MFVISCVVPQCVGRRHSITPSVTHCIQLFFLHPRVRESWSGFGKALRGNAGGIELGSDSVSE